MPRLTDARLLVVDRNGELRHTARARLADEFSAGDLVVANDAATIPASLRGVHLPSGEPLEIRLAARQTKAPADVHEFVGLAFGAGDHRTRTEDRAPPPPLESGDGLALGPLRATVTGRLGHARLVALRFAGTPDELWAGLAQHGRPIQYSHVTRSLALSDVWTPVAAVPAAFEAPSASFAVDWALLAALGARRVGFATITLAAGISSTGDAALDARLPLDEPYHVPPATVRAIAGARRRGGHIIAVGTSVTRALESAASRHGTPRPGAGLATQRLGARSALRVADAIVTGVHEAGTSHYEVLGAFAAEAVVRRASVALAERGYRSHEFGDSVLLWRGAACGGPGERGGNRNRSTRRWRGYPSAPVPDAVS
jgi:S-adenosylmethionine:tRNA ribosyltransferase-isomerase